MATKQTSEADKAEQKTQTEMQIFVIVADLYLGTTTPVVRRGQQCQLIEDDARFVKRETRNEDLHHYVVDTGNSTIVVSANDVQIVRHTDVWIVHSDQHGEAVLIKREFKKSPESKTVNSDDLPQHYAATLLEPCESKEDAQFAYRVL